MWQCGMWQRGMWQRREKREEEEEEELRFNRERRETIFCFLLMLCDVKIIAIRLLKNILILFSN